MEEIAFGSNRLLALGLSLEAGQALGRLLQSEDLTPQELLARVLRRDIHPSKGSGDWLRPVGKPRAELRVKFEVPLSFRVERLAARFECTAADVLYSALGGVLGRAHGEENSRTEPPLLILDLDQTLIDSTFEGSIQEMMKEAIDPVFGINVEEHLNGFERLGERDRCITFARPGLRAFLQRVQGPWRLAVWSANDLDHIQAKLEPLGLSNVEFILSIEDCESVNVSHSGSFAFGHTAKHWDAYKDLWFVQEMRLGRQGRMLLLDDSKVHLPGQWSSVWQLPEFGLFEGIPPKAPLTWEKEFLALADHLVDHANLEDVRLIPRADFAATLHAPVPFPKLELWRPDLAAP